MLKTQRMPEIGSKFDWNKTDNNGVVRVDMDNLAEAVNLLSRNPEAFIEKLDADSDIYQAFQLVSLAMTILYDTNINVLLNLIEKQPRPTRLYPGTAGAFLFGSYNLCYGGVEKHCSPIAIGSVPRKEGNDWTTKACPEQIWLLSDGHYAAITTSQTSKAHIYVASESVEDFEGFTEEELKIFADAGVEKAQILSSVGSKHLVLYTMRPISELPKSKTIVVVKNENSSDDSSSTSYGWIWFILIVIAIIFLILFLYQGKSSKSS